MKNPMKTPLIVAAIFCVMAGQGCTTNNTNYYGYSEVDKTVRKTPTGLSDKGSTGVASANGKLSQRTTYKVPPIEMAKGAGILGQESTSGNAFPAGLQQKKESFSDESYWAGIVKDTFQTLVRICAPVQCFN